MSNTTRAAMIMNKVILCPLPWKRGILFCNCRLVGESVCGSVDQVLSAQYLLTPSLDQYHTWCRGCPHWVDEPDWFSGHMFKGQGQTTLLSPVCCPLYIFQSLAYLLRTGFVSTSTLSQSIFVYSIRSKYGCSNIELRPARRMLCKL